jgi:hypothetical protein
VIAFEQATAETIFAPFRAMPSFSYFFPTINPFIFWRKSSGIFLWLHNSMKCVALKIKQNGKMLF